MNRVRIESAPHGSGGTLRLTAAQYDLLHRSAHAFLALVPGGPGRDLALGPGGADLPALLASAGPADDEGFVPVVVTPGQLHAVHAMLTTLVVLVPSELSFMEQVGHFRENAAGFAAGLRRAAGRLS
ncbi:MULTISPECIES: hypothetical protein [Streptomyces]|uniref:Uncharacterized protein n=1 Tax=Streptomyces solicathayae TaxID=3081768 RepID=A0ABZ0LS81_9ACTN|nr:hypothetical protein [Streptomyces sp. HUAS YS2]WOX22338.1 hypothetical protein R2D22_13415 [Streptomyces sp. HUAS YS2]